MDYDPQNPKPEGLTPRPPQAPPAQLIIPTDVNRGPIGGGSGRDGLDEAAERPGIDPGSTKNPMKIVILLLLIGGAAGGYYYYQHNQPEPIAVAPPPPTRHLAPEGVFYLTTWVRVESNDGITGLPPGTEVKLVKPGVYLTPSGEMPLDEKMITNDLDIAHRAQGQGVAGKVILNERQAIEEAKVAAMEGAASGDATSAQNVQLKELKRDRLTKLLAALKSRKSDLESRRKVLSSAQGQEGIGGAKGRGEPATTDQELAGIEGRLKLLSEEMADVEKTLRELK